MSTPVRYPLDFETLNKGDVIGETQLTAIFGLSSKYAAYRQKAHTLALRIEWELRELGCSATVITCKAEIHILTDAQAVAKHRIRRKKAVAQLKRNHRRTEEIDRAELGPETLIQHDRGLVQSGAMLVGLLGGYRKVPTLVYVSPHARLEQPKAEE
jgi:hypothetical protein